VFILSINQEEPLRDLEDRDEEKPLFSLSKSRQAVQNSFQENP
jgi:hypothetical protein